MASANVLIIMHGVIEDTAPSNHTQQYDQLWASLQQNEPDLTNAIKKVIRVEWGHLPLPQDGSDWPDTHLTDAENTLLAATSYDKIKASPTADDSFLSFELDILQRMAVRTLTKPIKETVETLGIADAFYYTAPDGELAVRSHVYSQVLDQLEPFRDPAYDKVALHMIGHSQGATISFDFLFGLIAPPSQLTGGQPGFLSGRQGPDKALEQFDYWRGQAQANPPRLVLGSMASFGSQVGLMMLRKQRLVDRLAKGELLDPTVVGVPTQADNPKWKIFFDTDDILGFPARRLFDAKGSIHEYEVDSDWSPVTSHTKYWVCKEVQTEIAKLVKSNLIP